MEGTFGAEVESQAVELIRYFSGTEGTPAVEDTPPAVEDTPPAVEDTPPAVEDTPPAVENTPPAAEEDSSGESE